MSWQGKKSEEKEQKRCLEEEIVDTPCKSNINTVVGKQTPYQKLYILMLFSIIDESPSISFQIVEKIEVISEVVLPEISKQIDLAMSKNKETKRNSVYLRKKTP